MVAMAFYFNHGSTVDQIDDYRPVPIEKTLMSPANESDHTQKQSLVSAKRAWRECKVSNMFKHPYLPQLDQREPQPTNLYSEVYNASDLIFNDAGQVTYGTWRALVIYLTQPENSMEFMRVFFIGFRLFASPRGLAEALAMRAHLPPPETESVPIQHKVLQVIKYWLSQCLKRNSRYPLPQRECLKLMCRINELYRDEAPGIKPMRSLAVPVPTRETIISQTPSEQPQLSYVEDTDRGYNNGELLSAPKRLLTRLFTHHKSSNNKRTVPGGVAMHRAQSQGSLTSTLTESTPSTQLKQQEADPVPGISELLMATVGEDLSVEAYRSSNILQVSPMDVACQLTIIESSCFCQIQPMELVNKEFSHGETSLAVNVRQMTKWSTQISRWASAVIPVRRLPADRRLEQQCLALKNYDAVMAIKAAIFCAAVMRLKSTWALLPKKFDATDPDRNYANYRDLLRRSQPPLLPFMGLYLTDLTFLEDGNPTYRRRSSTDSILTAKNVNRQSQPCTGSDHVDISDQQVLINFDKAYRVASIVKEIAKFQVEYSGNFTLAIPGLQKYLIEQWAKCEREGYDDDKIYEMSLEREPRPTQVAMRLTRLLPGTQRFKAKEAAAVQ
ncbi:ras GEF [Linderina pennispora]|uniref:Ras GEF n=1 Tax=Linderina pennispora TaxID=61395 RepID=A0A1Y1VXZ7_9FUNG|nr:ras GEF [Linderina pennispora]ORX66148.1 ras GEF [Linderina pennispora]